MRALTFIEIDVPSFVETSPETIETYRFAKSTDYLVDSGIEAIPSLVSVDYSPQRLSLGKDLGLRAELSITFHDHPHILGAEAFSSGTFWGKWRGRYGQRLRGRELRWIRGFLGETLAGMETRTFIIDSTDGPRADGSYTIIAKDILKLADNDRAQAPAPSSGFLIAGITSTDTTATLSPAGIGDAEYPASGYVNIGGEEIAQFTRSGDVLDFSNGTSPPAPDGRGVLGTDAAAHDAEDKVQLVLRYSGQDPGDIIADLLETYAGVDSAYIPLSSWNSETDNYLSRLYTATIPEPTGVRDLISELIEQAGLAMWWDDIASLIRLQVLRAIPTTAATFNEDNTLEKSLRIRDQPGKRVSEVWVYYGQRNPLEPLDEVKNYRSLYIDIDGDAETEYGSAAIHKVFSRWIPAFGRSNASTLASLILARFVDPPRRFNFATSRLSPATPSLGGGYQLGSRVFQQADGSEVTAPIQVTRLDPQPDRFDLEAEEMLYDSALLANVTDRTIIIDSNVNNFNLRTTHDSLYPEVTGTESPEVTLTCIVQPGVIVGSDDADDPAFDVGNWPMGFTPLIIVQGRIEGAGGRGGAGTATGTGSGEDGGTALYTRHAVNVNDTEGEIWGGGGGGAGGANAFGSDSADGGGGGAGQVPGAGGPGIGSGVAGDPGTTEAGGDGGFEAGGLELPAGDGGDPGEAGTEDAADPSFNSPGAAGNAVDGVSFVTFTGSPEGDRRGGEVN